LNPVDLAEGLRVRAPERRDLEAVLELIRACEEVDEGEAESTPDDLTTDWRLPGVDLGRDAWLVVSPAGRTVGYASIWQRVKGHRFESDGYTHPELPGQGIGTRLVRAVEAHAKRPFAWVLRQAQNPLRVNGITVPRTGHRQTTRTRRRGGCWRMKDTPPCAITGEW